MRTLLIFFLFLFQWKMLLFVFAVLLSFSSFLPLFLPLFLSHFLLPSFLTCMYVFLHALYLFFFPCVYDMPMDTPVCICLWRLEGDISESSLIASLTLLGRRQETQTSHSLRVRDSQTLPIAFGNPFPCLNLQVGHHV